MLKRGAVVIAIAGLVGCTPKDSAPRSVEPDAAPAPAQQAEPADTQPTEEPDDLDEADPQDAPPPMTDPDGPVTFKLHNLCKRTVNYALAPLRTGEVAVDDPKSIKPGAVEEITAAFGIGVHLLNAKSAAAAATDTNGGHVWISASCTGVGSSNDPSADPKKIDQQLRDKIERMTKAAAPESGDDAKDQ